MALGKLKHGGYFNQLYEEGREEGKVILKLSMMGVREVTEEKRR